MTLSSEEIKNLGQQLKKIHEHEEFCIHGDIREIQQHLRNHFTSPEVRAVLELKPPPFPPNEYFPEARSLKDLWETDPISRQDEMHKREIWRIIGSNIIISEHQEKMGVGRNKAIVSVLDSEDDKSTTGRAKSKQVVAIEDDENSAGSYEEEEEEEDENEEEEGSADDEEDDLDDSDMTVIDQLTYVSPKSTLHKLCCKQLIRTLSRDLKSDNIILTNDVSVNSLVESFKTSSSWLHEEIVTHICNEGRIKIKKYDKTFRDFENCVFLDSQMFLKLCGSKDHMPDDPAIFIQKATSSKKPALDIYRISDPSIRFVVGVYNQDNSHYLAYLMNLQKKQIFIANSMASDHEILKQNLLIPLTKWCKNTVYKLRPYTGESTKWHCEIVTSPQQPNFSDCGLYSAFAALFFLMYPNLLDYNSVDFGFTEGEIAEARKTIPLIILANAIKNRSIRFNKSAFLKGNEPCWRKPKKVSKPVSR